MKKILYFTLLILLPAFVATSCDQSGEANANDSDSLMVDSSLFMDEPEFSVNTLHFTDSADVDGALCTFDVDIDVPKGPKALCRNIICWIDSKLNGTYGDFNNDFRADTFDVQKPEFVQTWLQFYSKAFFDGAEIDEYANEKIGWTSEAKYKLLEETDKYVTYHYEGYDFWGGAHGMPFDQGCTFAKADGKLFDYNIFKRDTTDTWSIERDTLVSGRLKELIYSHLDEFFGEESPVEEAIFEDAVKDFPLPQFPPYLTKDGVVFAYGAYEIACYAAGMPKVTVPYKELEKYLADDVKALIAK